MQKLAFAVLFALGCSASSSDPQDGDDHSVDRLVLEGQQVVDLFGPQLTSPPMASTIGFRRLGVMWDATTEGALEIRTSFDGTTWSAWAAPQITSLEEIAHAGHVDAIQGLSVYGSLESDPRAVWYQLRVPAGAPLPTFLDIEPIEDIPTIVEEVATPEVEDDVATAESTLRTTPIGDFHVHTRAEWHARAPRCSSGSQTPNTATIHHTVTPTNDSMSVPARLRQIQAFHMFTRGWCDIGYNYLVSRDGRIWRGRGATTVGAHVENHNTGNVGISFLGTYTTTQPNAGQMCAAAKLLRRLHMDYSGISLSRTDVKGHRQYGGTSCPGTALYNRIDDIVRKAKSGCDTP